jgi:soluble lytic murein transglycosylase-like protein
MRRIVRRYRVAVWVGAAAFLLATASVAHADIYMFIDGNGVLHFSNIPTTSNYRVYMRERPKRTIAASDRYDRIIQKAANRFGLASALIKAVIKAESNFNPRAVSDKGAVGLMQIMPKTVKHLNLQNPFDPRENIMAGVRYFKTLYERYRGRLPLVLAAYNAGPAVVDRYSDVPPFPETRRYVDKVMRFYYAFNN